MVRGPARIGLVAILVFVLLFGGWGASAPLAGGALARGQVAPDGSVRIVQHLEGGIVDTLFVRDGDLVAAGSPLLALRQIASEAEVNTILDRWHARLAESARLEAELTGDATIRFPAALQEDPRGRTAMDAEQRVFSARNAMLTARQRVLRQRVQQLSEQIGGFQAQVASATAQLGFIQEETDAKRLLSEQGLIPRSELLRLHRATAELEGFRGEYIASIAQARQQIGEAELELVALEAERIEIASLRASEVRGELVELEQELAARRDVLARAVVTAPIAGVVTALKTKTEGGVIAPGETILEIVPTEEKLVIDAEISPSDIDVVSVGLEALVHLTAYPSRQSPRLTGKVTWISADRIFDEETRTHHYLAKVEVSKDELADLDDLALTVGMPAEVVLVSRSRTMLDYLLEPMTNMIRRAGRET